MNFLQEYYNEFASANQSITNESIEGVVSMLLESYENKRNVFLLGNGQSAIDTMDFALRLSSKCNIRATPLSNNIGAITKYANDESYNHTFSNQLETWFNDGDVIIMISYEGNCQNILNAISSINKNAIFIAFTAKDGGKIKEYSDINVNVNTQIESIFHIVNKMTMNYIIELIAYIQKNNKG